MLITPLSSKCRTQHQQPFTVPDSEALFTAVVRSGDAYGSLQINLLDLSSLVVDLCPHFLEDLAHVLHARLQAGRQGYSVGARDTRDV